MPLPLGSRNDEISPVSTFNQGSFVLFSGEMPAKLLVSITASAAGKLHDLPLGGGCNVLREI
jgi:hypothetical protein